MSSIKEYTCPNCKAGLAFNPESQKLKCDYCLSEFSEAELDVNNNKNNESTQDSMDNLNSYSCASCGAELIADETTAATFCVYCNSHSIIKNRFSGKFEPKSIIPFKLSKEDAEEIYKKWIKQHKFAPNEFKDKTEVEKLTGIYIPFWLFNNSATGQLTGEGIKVKTWSDKNYKYTQTKYYNIIRECTAKYTGIPIDGLNKIDNSLMLGIEPYDYKELTDFSMKYMSGYMAEKYDVDASEAAYVASERVKQYLGASLSETVKGYSKFTKNSNICNITNIDYSYIMLPLYFLSNEFNGKKYEFIINGQTGKIIGDTPIDRKSQFKFAFIIFLICWLIIAIGGAIIG